MTKYYTLPKLNYGYQELAPFISKKQLTIHHQLHHQSYVNSANDILKNIEKARKANSDIDMKATLKALSFNVGGHVLHSLFWENLTPQAKGGGGKPKGLLLKAIESEFGSVQRFKKEFSQTASSVEGSGWAALTFCQKTQRPLIMQIEKHNVNIYPSFKVLMVLDVWEHAYYLDYQNKRAEFIDNFWNIVNWSAIENRFEGK